MNFSIHRLGHLIKRDILMNARLFSILIVSILLIVSLIMFISTEEYCNTDTLINVLDVIFFFSLFASGAIFSASIFKEFRQSGSRSQYLSLPASTLEKWLSKWILAVPVHILISFILITLSYTVMGNILHNVWSECHFIPLSEISRSEFSNSIKTYFIFQAICLICGIVYNKYALIKTLATALIIMLLFSAIMTILIKITNGAESNLDIHVGPDKLASISYFITPLIWLASYFKLKEKEL